MTRVKMKTSADIRRTLARISNATLTGEIDAKKANTVIYACNVCLAAIRTDEQQKRIEELERLVNQLEPELKLRNGVY